jgi:nicotinamide mononucleotide transporter
MKKIIRDEFSNWKLWEVLWLGIACAVITGLSIYWGDTTMGIISATTGVACVVATGKGKLMAYAFGLVNCVLYAIISYNAGLYGETMLNAAYYVPMQFVGAWLWAKHMDNNTKEVEKHHMTWVGRILATLGVGVGTWLYGMLLAYMGDPMPYLDAFTTVTSVVAMVLSVKMFSEQWWIWVIVDVMTVIMWAINFAKGQDNIATLLMWIVYLGNAVIMLVKWEKEAHKRDKEKANV